MALEEQYGSRRIKYLRAGASGYREFYGDWADALLYAPKPGESWPGFADLTVEDVEVIPSGQQGSGGLGLEYTHARVKVNYSLDYTRVGLTSEPRLTYQGDTEVLFTATGRVYDDTGDKIDGDMDASDAVVYPTITYTMDLAVPSIPISAITTCLGKVNNAEFQGATAGSLLFLTLDAVAQYDYQTQDWYHRLTYSFLWRSEHTHNEIWRPPKRVWDDTAGDWARNADGTYQYVAGSAGDGAWTTTTPALYESADFSTLLP